MRRIAVVCLVALCLFSFALSKEWKAGDLTVTCYSELLDQGYGTAAKPLPIVIRSDGDLNRYLYFEWTPMGDLTANQDNQVNFLPRGRHTQTTVAFQYDAIPWDSPKLLSVKIVSDKSKAVCEIRIWVVKTATLPGSPPTSEIQVQIDTIQRALEALKTLYLK